MRLLILDPFNDFSGPAQFCRDILRGPLPEQLSVLILKETPGPEDDALRQSGCKVEIVAHTGMTPAIRDWNAWVRYPLDSSRALLSIRRWVQSFKPTMILANTELNLLAGLMARALGIPAMARVHAQTLSDHGWIGALYARALGHAYHLLLCNSVSTFENLRDMGVPCSRLAVLENAVDNSRFVSRPPCAELRGELGASMGQFLAICVAHHAPIKGLHVLLEAFEQFAQRYGDVHLSIIGGVTSSTRREYSESLHARVDDSPILRERVTFHAPSNQIHQMLAQADVVIQPSLNEAFGRVAIEAASCGIAVIASDTGGLRETVLDAQTGWLVTPGDPAALAGALEDAYVSPSKRRARGLAGIAHSSKYCVERISKRFYELCDEVAAEPGTRSPRPAFERSH